MNITRNISKIHKRLKPLSWIIGEWRSVKAVVNYPTMNQPISYSEKLIFTSSGHPFLNYQSLTWNTEDGSPIHLENGFLMINEDQTSIALIAAQKFGCATIEEGTLQNHAFTTTASSIGHIKYIQHKVVRLQRCYKLNENCQLEYRAMMETSRVPLTEHTTCLYDLYI